MTAKRIGDADQYIGQRIRQFRHMADMSQTDLANEIGLTFQQVQKYEKGSNRVGGSRLVQIAEALKREPHDFFPPVKGTNNNRDVANVSAVLATTDGLTLVNTFATIKSDKLRRAIVLLTKALVEGEDK